MRTQLNYGLGMRTIAFMLSVALLGGGLFAGWGQVYAEEAPTNLALPGTMADADEEAMWNHLVQINDVFSMTVSDKVRISPNGRYVAFIGYRFVGDATGGELHSSLMLYDRESGALENVLQPKDGSYQEPMNFAMSADARWFAFSGKPSFTEKTDSQMYLYDRQEDEVRLVSKQPNGLPGLGQSDHPSISADGRYVAYDSQAPDLAEGDVANFDVFVYDRDSDANELISVPAVSDDTGEVSWGNSSNPSISADGRHVAFDSSSRFLVAGDDNGYDDVFVYDRAAKQARLISVPAAGGQADNASGLPSMSADGSVVAFESDAALAEDDTNEEKDIYVYRSADASVRRVSVAADGAQNAFASYRPLLSADGAYVTFEMWPEASELEYAMIADLAAGTARTITVADPERQLTEWITNVAVANGGAVAAFNGGYMVKDPETGEDVQMPGLFVAAKSAGDVEAPAWPEGSKLEALDVQPDTIELAWTPATHPKGIKAYRLYRDGERIADLNGTATSYKAADLHPATEYTFRIEAVGADDAASAGGPSLKIATLADDRTLDLSLKFDRLSAKKLPLSGGKLTIEAKAKTGRAINAKIAYADWLDEAGARLPAPRATETTVPLIERTAGTGNYAAVFPLREGIAELTSVTAVMTGAPSGPVETPAAGLPLSVAGAIRTSFDNPGGIDLTGAYLMAANEENTGSASVVLKDGASALLEGLTPSETYTVTLLASSGKELGKQTGVRVAAGLATELALEVRQTSRLRFQVVDQDNKPVNGIPVEVWDEAGTDYLAGYQTDPEGLTSWYDVSNIAKKFTAKVDLRDTKYDTLPNIPVTLTRGDNVVPITVRKSAEGKLQGKVTTPDGKPVFNALVTVTQQYKGEPVVQKTFTDTNGGYLLTAYAGEAAVQAAQTSYHYNSEEGLKAVIEGGKTTTLNIPVRMAEQGMVTFDVYVKTVGGQWQGPVDMEQMRFGTKLWSKHGGSRTSYYQNAVQLQGSPGEEVEACVQGVLHAAFTACETITLDDEANGRVEVRIEETGGVFAGTVTGAANMSINANLYEVVGDELEYVRSTSVRKNKFELYADKAGTYRLEFNGRDPVTKKMWTGFKQAVIREQETLNVGAIAMQPADHFSHVTANGFLAQPTEVAPGGTVNLRAFYMNGGTAVDDGMLKIVLPSGVVPVTEPGSNRIPVKVNGAAAAAVLNGNTIEVALGTLDSKAQGTVVLQARLDAAYDQGQAQLSARMEGKSGGAPVAESLGAVQLEVPKVTLEAPGQTSASALQVLGVAPAGSQVRIYDDNLLLATVSASSAGTWRSTVELTAVGGSDVHLLWAEADSGGRKLRSDRRVVAVNSTDPVLQEIAMAQYPNGKWLYLNLENGAAQLPYTVVPGNPFAFLLKFSEPDKVKNARIYLGGQIGGPITAEKGDDGLFRATVPTSSGALGGLYVDFDTVKPKTVVSRDIPTEEETKDALPARMQNFEIVEKTPFAKAGNVYSGSAVIEFPDVPGLRLEASQKIDVTPTAYRPTVEEIVEAEATGLLMYNVSLDVEETADGVNVKLKGYVPGSVFFEDFGSKRAAASTFASLSDDGGGVDPLEVLDELGIDSTPYQQGMIQVSHEYHMLAKEASAPFEEIKGQYEGYRDYAGKITKIMDNVEAATLCPENIEATGEQAGKALLVTVGGEIAKTAIGAWTGAMMLEGPVGAIGGFAGKYVSNKIDSYVDEQIDKVKTVGPTSPQSCEEDANYDDFETENIYKKRLRRVYAKLKWIYDPSGYVYEAVPTNRLEGVKATVLFKEKATGEWKVWNDAEAYGQINPQLTDGEGRYGWDVPEGLWKVVWEKAGYEIASSAELTVPPPHFDVNAGLISMAPPIVSGIEAKIGKEGSYIDIRFSKYVKTTDPIAAGAITVTGPEGETVDGTAAYAERQEGQTDALSRIVRFTPTGGGLQEGVDYTVAIQPESFTSYAGVKMFAGAEQTARAIRLDAEGPVPVSAELASGNAVVRLRFNEPLAAGQALNPESFELDGTNQSVLAAVVEQPEGGEQPKAVILTLTGAVPAGTVVSVNVAAGAAADPNGNPSAEKALALSGPNATLSGLVVEGGTLSEPFSKEKLDYTLKVSEKASSFQLKATLAAAGGKLSIRGIPLADGALKTIEIPSDGIIPIRVEAANHPDVAKVYTLTVQRTAGPGPGPGPIPGGGGSGGGSVPVPAEEDTADAADLGRGAEVTSRTTEDGRKQAVVSIKAEAVLGALKSAAGKDGLYVQIPSGVDAYDIVLPAEAFRALVEAKTKLTVKGELMSVVIQPDAWTPQLSNEASDVHFVVDRASAQEEQAWVNGLRAKFGGLTAASGLYRFTAFASIDGRHVQLSASRSDAATMQWAKPEAASNGAGLYRYDATSKEWQYAAELPTSAKLPTGGEHAESSYFGAMTYASVFADIDGHWAKDAIDWMAARLFASGVSAHSFEPNRQVTRAEFAAMLARIVGGTSDDDAPVFEDVKPGDWYYDAVQAAYAKKLVSGDGHGKFHPTEYVTREQMTVMAWRAYEQLAGKAVKATEEETKRLLQPFLDQSAIEGWARGDVASAIQAGLAQGVSSARFDPDGAATRAQAAVMLQRIAKKLGE